MTGYKITNTENITNSIITHYITVCTRGWALNLSIEYVTHAGQSIAFIMFVTLTYVCDLDLLTKY